MVGVIMETSQSGEGGGGGRRPKDETRFVVDAFAQVESRITKYCIIRVTYVLRLREGQYRAQICPLGNAHILASSHKDVPSYPRCWRHYYDSQCLREISAH